MSEQKKLIKCGTCGQEGHNKRTCPTLKPERVLEIKHEPQIIYALNYAEDNGDSVDRRMMLYASLDGLVKGIEDLIRGVQTDLCTEEDELSDTEDDDPPSYVKNLFYYTHHESMKNVPIPTREFIETALKNKKRSNMDGLIIKVGPTLGGAAYFSCEISIHEKKLNP